MPAGKAATALYDEHIQLAPDTCRERGVPAAPTGRLIRGPADVALGHSGNPVLSDRNMRPMGRHCEREAQETTMSLPDQSYDDSFAAAETGRASGTGIAPSSLRQATWQPRVGGKQRMCSGDEPIEATSRSALVERRAHRRMEIRLPVECRKDGDSNTSIVRTITHDVSTGGMSFELDAPDFCVGDQIRIDITVPPAEGVSPYQGRASCRAEILRINRISAANAGGVERHIIAARFLGRLRLEY